MSTTAVPSTTPRASQPASPTQPRASGPVTAIRAFAVMLGGPVILLAGVVSAAAQSLKALRAGHVPRPRDVAILGAAVAYRRSFRPWMRSWGATDAEVAMALAGDGALPDFGSQQTRVVAIDASASEVWRWIAQIGQDRGGFYSYTWLENLAGCRMRNADRVHPEWQRRKLGDTVLLHPSSGLKVVGFEPGRALTLEGGWSLVVLDDGPGRSRLVARSRAPRGIVGSAYALLLELPHFIMERRMMLAVKRLAEHSR